MQRRFRSGMLATAGVTSAAAIVLLGAPQQAQAVPSFARQTGLACEACHTVFPELTPFGRRFKLNGYVLTTKQQVSDIDAQKHSTLSLADLPPLSVMLQASTTWWNKALPDTNGFANTDNNNTQFPQQLSLFYSGKIADHFGAFIQMTYSQHNQRFGMDNTDIRYADNAFDNKLTYGVTLNNNPTVTDLWNSTPGWAAGANAFSPPSLDKAGATQVVSMPNVFMNGLGANVAGVTAYADYKNFYLEAGGYRGAAQAVTSNGDTNANATAPTISGIAPYWRAAYEYDWGKNSLAGGTFGMFARAIPSGAASAVGVNEFGYNTYLDTGLDAQYQYIGEDHIFSTQARLIHENQSNGTGFVTAGKANSKTDVLNTFNLTGSYFYRHKYGGSIAYNRTTGSTDAAIYGAGSNTTADGSANGNPSSQWEVFEVDYMPWLNTKLLAQYTMYNWIKGGSAGYNGGTTPRNAADNNTMMIGLWTAF